MLHKKEKQTQSTTEPKKKKSFSAVRFLVILMLIAINSVVRGYVFCAAQLFYDDYLYEKRSTQQHFLARLRPVKKKAVDAIAFVDGEPITLEQIQEMVEEMPQLKELPFETVYPNLLEMFINNRVIMQSAKKAGLFDRPEIKTQLRIAQEQIVGQTYLDELLASHVTEEEMRTLYDQEVQNFQREEEIHARHILVKTEKEAKDIIVQLKAGADFAELANKKSLDENTTDGDLGYFTKSMMIPEFGDAVFDMKKGQLSNPIKTAFGWHVVLVEDKRLANPPSFEEIHDDIMRAVMETKLPQVIEEERAKMKVQILKPSLEVKEQ